MKHKKIKNYFKGYGLLIGIFASLTGFIILLPYFNNNYESNIENKDKIIDRDIRTFISCNKEVIYDGYTINTTIKLYALNNKLQKLSGNYHLNLNNNLGISLFNTAISSITTSIQQLNGILGIATSSVSTEEMYDVSVTIDYSLAKTIHANNILKINYNYNQDTDKIRRNLILEEYECKVNTSVNR
jgi:hypothetical protein